MMRGMRAHSSLTVFSPSVMTSGRARSCTKASTSCRSTAVIASGGTSSWQACNAAQGVSCHAQDMALEVGTEQTSLTLPSYLKGARHDTQLPCHAIPCPGPTGVDVINQESLWCKGMQVEGKPV